MELKVGDQIVYIPGHADGKDHPDSEYGFVTSFNKNGDPFCCYWLNPDKKELRTKANSECTPIDMIEKCKIKQQGEIDVLLKGMGYIE